MKNNTFKSSSAKGFTLIELLVVVAIIGLLAATILASLGSARSKARLARAQSEISSMRAAAELYYSENGSYSDGLYADLGSGMVNLVKSVEKTAGGAGNTKPLNDDNSWAYSATIGTVEYCADSNGYSGLGKADQIGSEFACIQL
jgi:prepilin-type N-terminal cleavage/methylation domain-containing protein